MKPLWTIKEIADHVGMSKPGVEKKLKKAGILIEKIDGVRVVPDDTVREQFPYAFDPSPAQNTAWVEDMLADIRSDEEQTPPETATQPTVNRPQTVSGNSPEVSANCQPVYTDSETVVDNDSPVSVNFPDGLQVNRQPVSENRPQTPVNQCQPIPELLQTDLHMPPTSVNQPQTVPINQPNPPINQPQTAVNDQADDRKLALLEKTVEMLQQQLIEKDKQIASRDDQVRLLQQQMQQALDLTQSSQQLVLAERAVSIQQERRKSFWRRFLGL